MSIRSSSLMSQSRRAPGLLRKMIFNRGMLLSAGLIGALTFTSAAQSTPKTTAATSTTTTQPPAHHNTHRHRHAKTAEPAVVAPVVPPTPPPPPPPADQTPHPATISYSQGVLRVDAENSSLVQTLNQISQKTGLAIEGLNHDQRIYGQYGPGSLTDTVTKLLDGAGYDYVIVGGNGKAAAKLILSPASKGGATASTPAPSAASTSPAPDEGDSDNPETADPTEPPQAKTTQEMFDEIKRMHPQH